MSNISLILLSILHLELKFFILALHFLNGFLQLMALSLFLPKLAVQLFIGLLKFTAIL